MITTAALRCAPAGHPCCRTAASARRLVQRPRSGTLVTSPDAHVVPARLGPCAGATVAGPGGLRAGAADGAAAAQHRYLPARTADADAGARGTAGAGPADDGGPDPGLRHRADGLGAARRPAGAASG